MLPFDNKSEFQIILNMPEGSSLESTAQAAREIAAAVRKEPEVRDYQIYAGTAAPFNFNGEDLLLERVAAVAEDSHLTLDVGVCLRASCPPNQCQKALPCDKRSDNSGPGMISENDRITC
ncbi:MAG: hypothetical protein WBL39_00730, partial [Terrimicrobiaceae bacterium]